MIITLSSSRLLLVLAGLISCFRGLGHPPADIIARLRILDLFNSILIFVLEIFQIPVFFIGELFPI